MKTVYKYPVPRHSTGFGLMLPVGAKFIRIGFQREELQIWFEVIPGNSLESVSFKVFGTGHEIPDSATWLATFDDGPFVLHLYKMN